nr:ABC transporter permease [uncultured Romboutsia sp.]
MKNLIMLEFKKIKTGVIITTLLSVIYIILNINKQITSAVFENSLEPWIYAIDWYPLFFPLIVVIPTCWVNYYERKNKFINYTFPRISKRKILSSKIITYLTCSFLIMFLTIFIGGIYSFLIAKPNAFELTGSYTLSNNPLETRLILGSILVNQPIIYILLHSI